MKKHKKVSRKMIIAIITTAVVISIIVALIFIFAILPNITVNEKNVMDEKNCGWCDEEMCVYTSHCEMRGDL